MPTSTGLNTKKMDSKKNLFIYKKMKINLIVLFFAVCAAGAWAQEYKVPVTNEKEQMVEGQYKPQWESLRKHKTPEWFRDAKFGIWAHWGPQCVEGSGDWMARNMYKEGTYGHPSEVGFKDILPLFKAEKWDPDKLVERYKRLGAQYIFVLGNHHDNFDLWDSKYQPWNSVNMGPKKDLIAGWAKASKKYGLPLGISFHTDHAWLWYEPAQRYDINGPKAGIHYDGKLTKADGKGKWWEGYDPQDLYAQNHPMSEKSWANNRVHVQWAWSGGACLPTLEYVTNFYDRTLDAINRYNPDLIYFDVTVAPFHDISDCGLKIASHFYNKNLSRKGVQNGVLTIKRIRKGYTLDRECSGEDDLQKNPFLVDTTVNPGWFYMGNSLNINKEGGDAGMGSVIQGKTKDQLRMTAGQIVDNLVDIVSKNGNMMLNVGLRADGSLPETFRDELVKIGNWLKLNGEAIYDTRPFKVYGEGTFNMNVASGKKQYADYLYKFTAKDIRFTTKKNVIYIFTLDWPGNGETLKVQKLNNQELKNIQSISFLASGEKVKWTQDESGLYITTPAAPVGEYAYAFKVTMQ